jgi:AraC-like DNA-binding protein
MNKFTAAIYYFVVKTGAYVKIEGFLTALFILSIAIWSMRIPVFASYQPIVLEEEKEVKKYAKSTLKEDQSDEIWNQIKELMEDKYLYRNPTLRLSDLVQEIGKPLPHVSQVINERMDMTFLDFVNQYRVKEAKELLCDEKVKSMTILAIAYEVGFNSKTTFYTSFKKVTGQTPSEYRKSKKK